jgi:hypothetical protein
VKDETIQASVEAHWKASAAGNLDEEHEIYADDVICDYPQSDERIVGRVTLQALRAHHPDKPSGFEVKRIVGTGSLWVTEYIIAYKQQSSIVVSIMEFCGGKVVHETQYFSEAFDPPKWRSQLSIRIT